jgi:hypothetical protein
MDAIVRTDVLPSAVMVLAVGGAIVLAIGVVLLQKAARIHRQEQRCDQLRKRVAQVEAQWREAAM